MINDDENAVKTVSKCLACMKGCWGPEFEPSVEEIVDYPMISLLHLSQFAFSSELAFRAGGFPYSVEHMAGQWRRKMFLSRGAESKQVKTRFTRA